MSGPVCSRAVGWYECERGGFTADPAQARRGTVAKCGWCMAAPGARVPHDAPKNSLKISCECACHENGKPLEISQTETVAATDAAKREDEAMAQKVIVSLTDDLDGKPADETVTFGLDGLTYEIDLSEKNAKALRDALAKYVGSGRKVSGRSARSGGSKPRSASNGSGNDAKAVREWATAQGMEVPARGRLPKEVQDAYKAAHPAA